MDNNNQNNNNNNNNYQNNQQNNGPMSMPPMQNQQMQAPGTPPRTNVMAILSLVFAFILAPLGIVFGVISLNQIKKTGEDGKGLATAGLITSSVFVVLAVLWIIFMVIAMISAASTFNDAVQQGTTSTF